jgi:hypothetical protein
MIIQMCQERPYNVRSFKNSIRDGKLENENSMVVISCANKGLTNEEQHFNQKSGSNCSFIG